MSSTIKTVIGVVVGLVLLAAIYFFATSGSKPAAPSSPLQSSTATQSQTQSVIGSDDAALSDKFLSLLLNIRTIKLDQTIFSSPAFTSLKDFTTTLSADTNPGRVNPFAPINSDSGSAPVTLSVTTGPVTSVGPLTATFVGALSAGAVGQAHYFEYGTANVVPLPNQTADTPGNPNSGVFSFTIAGLVPNTTYYVRAAAKVGGIPVYGSVVSFTTLAR